MAKDPKAILGEDVTHGFRVLARLWHPDVNKDPKAPEVLRKLLALRDLAHGKVPAEVIRIPGGTLTIEGGLAILTAKEDCERASRGIAMLRRAESLVARTPEVLEVSPQTLTMKMRTKDSVTMSAVLRAYPNGVPQRHVAWMASRLYEVVRNMSRDTQYICGGLTVATLCVGVEDHGVTPMDWRFMEKIGNRLKQVPAELVPLVPADKKAAAAFDMRAVHRIALQLLGDPSGIGNALLTRVKDPTQLHPQFLNWFRAMPGSDPTAQYEKYRKLLADIFGPPKYHKLEL